MEALNSETLSRWLQEQVAELVERTADEIALDTPLAEQGLDSVDAVGLSGELEELLQIELDPTIAYEYPSIEQLVSFLQSEGHIEA